MSPRDTLTVSVEIPEPQLDVVHPMADFFNHQRRRLKMRKYARVPRPQDRRAVVTMVHNESVFFPIWLRYYSRFFAPEDIFVLDNESIDGSTDGDGFVRMPVQHDRVDHTWMAATVGRLQNELMESYEVVLATDVDEIVAPDPALGTWAPISTISVSDGSTASAMS